ncbi:hypothetical protein D1872_328030 [compost metagenome]
MDIDHTRMIAFDFFDGIHRIFDHVEQYLLDLLHVNGDVHDGIGFFQMDLASLHQRLAFR